MAKVKDMTGLKFGRLLVIERAEDKPRSDGRSEIMWKCLCDCGNYTVSSGRNLRKGRSQSCGCLAKERMSIAKKKYNNYDLTGDYGIGYTYNIDTTDSEQKRNYFYFDLEDYNLIKDYCWSFSHGYLSAWDPETKKLIKLHRLIMNADDNLFVDHIKHNKYDNRKKYLRITTKAQNNINHKLRKDNVTGCSGVYWVNYFNKYMVYVGEKYIGRSSDLNEAINMRKEAEKKIFGEYSYEESMAYE